MQVKARTEDSRDIFCIDGIPPEELAYTMSAYSRTSKGFKQTNTHINAKSSEEFLKKFCIDYGHASIADQAHIPMALENISILAAIEVVAEQLWDGQERSTRYQDFTKTGYLIPSEVAEDIQDCAIFRQTVDSLFQTYDYVLKNMVDYYEEVFPKDSLMSKKQHNKIITAKAFDVARYLLPLCTNTSLGQIVSARTLEKQISRLLTSKYGEVQRVGRAIQDANLKPAWNPQKELLQSHLQWANSLTREDEEALRGILYPFPSSPTLVRYIEPTWCDTQVKAVTMDILGSIFNTSIEDFNRQEHIVELVCVDDAITAIIAKLFYSVSHLRFKTCVEIADSLTASDRKQFLDEVFQARGEYDAVVNQFKGSILNFDILMDIGGFRDLHRHRRTEQIRQTYTPFHGYSVPDALMTDTDSTLYYNRSIEDAHRIANELGINGDYLLPLGTYCRSLFSMDISQLIYMTELRSKESGHMSYRSVAYAMYLETIKKYPELSGHIRITPPHQDT